MKMVMNSHELWDSDGYMGQLQTKPRTHGRSNALGLNLDFSEVVCIQIAIALSTYQPTLFAFSLSILSLGFASFTFVCLFHCIWLHLNWYSYHIRYGKCEIYKYIHAWICRSCVYIPYLPIHAPTDLHYVDLYALFTSYPLIQGQTSFSQERSKSTKHRSFHVGAVSNQPPSKTFQNIHFAQDCVDHWHDDCGLSTEPRKCGELGCSMLDMLGSGIHINTLEPHEALPRSVSVAPS